MRMDLPPEATRARDEARRLVESELTRHDAAIEETGRIPESAVESLRRAGFFGLNTPRSTAASGSTCSPRAR